MSDDQQSQSVPLITLDVIKELRQAYPEQMSNVIADNPLNRAVRGFRDAALQAYTTGGPALLRVIGVELSGIIPNRAYRDVMEPPPLSAYQLQSMLANQRTLKYIAQTMPGVIGPKTISSLTTLVGLLLESSERS